MFTISNFSRYNFEVNKVGAVLAFNKATTEPINLYSGAKVAAFRLTNDEGKRVVLTAEKIKEQAPKVAEIPTMPEPQTLVDTEAMQPEAQKALIHNPEHPHTPTLVITATLPETKKSEEAPAPKKAKAGKLTEDQVLQIQKRALNGEKQAALAAEFKIHASTVSEIKSAKLFTKITKLVLDDADGQKANK